MLKRLLRILMVVSGCFAPSFYGVAADTAAAGDVLKSTDTPRVTRLQGEIIDSRTEQPVAARVSLRSAAGEWYFPRSAVSTGSSVEYRRQVSPTSLEQHVTLSADPFEVDLPAGTYSITIERGKEYRPLIREIEVADQPLRLRFALERWIDMAKLGWYSGDVHSHRPLAETTNLVLAEDLNIAFPLSHWVTVAETSPVAGNRIVGEVPAAKWIAVDPTHGIYPLNTEYEIFQVGQKSHTLGAVLILGQTAKLEQGIPPVRRIAELAHRQGAFLDLEKHSWAWTPMIVPLMKPDLFELVNNHCWPTDFAFHEWTFEMASKSMHLETNPRGFTEWGWIEFGLKSYYAYLNCGFRMMPSAGTGSGVHPVPLGFGRVYVNVPGEFTFEKWRAGLLKGESFVTTGPLLQVTFNGERSGKNLPGDPQGTRVQIAGTVHNLAPLDRIELLVNGNIVQTIKPTRQADVDETAASVTHIDETLDVKGSCWLAVRCFEVRPDRRLRFAHTAPVFIEVPGEPQAPYRDEVEHFVERIERDIRRHQSVLKPELIEEYEQALEIYRQLLNRSVARPPVPQVR